MTGRDEEFVGFVVNRATAVAHADALVRRESNSGELTAGRGRLAVAKVALTAGDVTATA